LILKVGITGGIGSGKTMVAKVFEVLGISVYYADDAAKKLMNEDVVLKEQLIATFGSAIYKEGQLNRQLLSSIVFNDSEQLKLLNSIVHPATIADAQKWILLQNTPYVIKEAALLFESNSNKQLDKIIGVYAPAPLRLQRVMARDKSDEAAVMARMNKQMNEQEKMRLCDYVINNNEEKLIVPQVLKIHEILLAICGEN